MFPFKSLINKSSKNKSPSPSASSTSSASATPSVHPRFPTVPSVSHIAPLPETSSHGQLPILSIDGRVMPDAIPEDNRLSVTSNTHTSVSIDRSMKNSSMRIDDLILLFLASDLS